MKKCILIKLSVLSILPLSVEAQRYSTLIDSSLSNGGGLEGLINNIFLFAISLAAIFAVIKIILGGVKYMLTDIVTTKESAKKDIKGALLGLIIILAAVFILETINPNLTKFQLQFQKPAAQTFTNPFGNSAGQNNAAANAASSFPCAVPGGPTPGPSGQSTVTTLDVSGCDQTDAAAALQQFADDCRSNFPNAGFGTSQGGTVGACAVPIQQSTTPSVEFSLNSYDDDIVFPGVWITYELDDQYANVSGNTLTYRIVDQCRDETNNLNDFDECKYDINYRMKTASTFTDEAGFCAHNAAKSCEVVGNNIVVELPTWKVKHTDLEDAYRASVTGGNVATWDLQAFRTQCGRENGEVKDIQRLDLGGSYGPGQNSLDDYRCVRY